MLGVFLFSDIVRGSVINLEQGGYVGFSDFGRAMLTLFKITTNEDWNNIMADTLDDTNCRHGSDCVSTFALPYFLSFHVICGYLMLNLFVLIALEQFDRYYVPKDDVMARFRADLEHFLDVWVYISGGGQFLSETRVPLLMQTLRAPLGIAEGQVKREVVKMRVRVDCEGRVGFHEMLFRVMKRLYGSHELHEAVDMQIFEVLTLDKVTLQSISKIN